MFNICCTIPLNTIITAYTNIWTNTKQLYQTQISKERNHKKGQYFCLLLKCLLPLHSGVGRIKTGSWMDLIQFLPQ